MLNAMILDMGFAPTVADLDVYRRANAKPDGFEYYEYILVYVDDILIIPHDPDLHLKQIKASYELNPKSVGPPTRYLGADVKRVIRPGRNRMQVLGLLCLYLCQERGSQCETLIKRRRSWSEVNSKITFR